MLATSSTGMRHEINMDTEVYTKKCVQKTYPTFNSTSCSSGPNGVSSTSSFLIWFGISSGFMRIVLIGIGHCIWFSIILAGFWRGICHSWLLGPYEGNMRPSKANAGTRHRKRINGLEVMVGNYWNGVIAMLVRRCDMHQCKCDCKGIVKWRTVCCLLYSGCQWILCLYR